MGNKKDRKNAEKEIEEKNYYEIKPSWREIFEDWIRFFAAYAITAIILILLIKYF